MPLTISPPISISPLPDVSDENGDINPRRLSDPADRDRAAERRAQEIVGGTKRSLQEERPGLADDHWTDEERDDQYRHNYPAAAKGSDHRERQGEPEDKLDDDNRDRENERYAERRPGQGIVDDLRETLEADEIVARNLEVVVDEGDPERKQQRIDRERQDQQRCRGDN